MSSRQKGPAWLPGGRWWISGSQVVRSGLGAESEHPPCIGRAFAYQGDLPGEVLPVVHDGLRHRSGLVVIPDDDEEEWITALLADEEGDALVVASRRSTASCGLFASSQPNGMET